MMTDQELNEAVARKLGWVKHPDGQWNKSHSLGGEVMMFNALPDYSTDIKAAWEILAKYQWEMKTTKYGIDIRIYDEAGEYPAAVADTAPRAICEAFLKLP